MHEPRGSTQSHWLPIGLLLGSVLALLLLAPALGRVDLAPGGSFNLIRYLLSQVEFASPPPMAPDGVSAFDPRLLMFLRIFYWVVLPLIVVYTVVSSRFRRALIQMSVLALAIFLVLRRLQANQEQPPEEFVPGAWEQPPVPAVEALPAPPDFVTATPTWFMWTVEGLLLLLLALALYIGWRRFRPSSEEPPTHALIADEADRAVLALEAGAPVGAVVQQCYAAMVELLEQTRQAHRHRAMTPRDFAAHLARMGIRDDEVHRLTLLFERVRYGTTVEDAELEAEAVDCLRQLAASYDPQRVSSSR